VGFLARLYWPGQKLLLLVLNGYVPVK
jgi:hypothetical protein